MAAASFRNCDASWTLFKAIGMSFLSTSSVVVLVVSFPIYKRKRKCNQRHGQSAEWAKKHQLFHSKFKMAAIVAILVEGN
jgi:hypothetical protein